MTSFAYRDSRRASLVQVLTMPLPQELLHLRAVMENVIVALDVGDWRVTDQAFLAVAEESLSSFGDPFEILAFVNEDPVMVAAGAASALTFDQAAAVAGIPRPFGVPPPDYLDQLRVAVDQDETLFNELFHAAHHHWIVRDESERFHPFDDVGVLLPVRLETLFDRPNTKFNDSPSQWKLSLRVIPDEASICRDDDHVSNGEQTALIAFWQAVQQPGAFFWYTWLDGDAAAIAWKALADRVTPERAAWLVSTIEPIFNGGVASLDLPADMPAKPRPNRVGGMPKELQVLIRSHVQNVTLRLPMDETQVIDQQALTLPLPKNLEEEKERWWASWKTAKAVGLGGEWLLPEGVTPNNIKTLYLTGIGDETPEDHFKAQVDSGEFGVLRLGIPTNSVHGATALDTPDWRRVAQQRLHERLDWSVHLAHDAAQNIQLHLTGDRQALPFFPGAASPDDCLDSQMMVKALWPALWGHWFRDVRQLGGDAYRVGVWAMDNLCPEGPLMPVRIADQPYGLLPVTALWFWESQFTADPEQAAQGGVQLTMAKALANLADHCATSIVESGNVVGKSSNDFIRILGKDALSRDYVRREFAPVETLGNPYQLNQVDQVRAGDMAREAYETAFGHFGIEVAKPYLTDGYWRYQELPLVQATRMLFRHQRGEGRGRISLSQFLAVIFDQLQGGDVDHIDIDALFNFWWVFEDGGEWLLSTLPDSLLIRLLTYASQLAESWRRFPLGIGPEQQLLEVQQKAAMSLAEKLDVKEWQQESLDPVTKTPIYTTQIPDDQLGPLERVTRATLDSAAHRIDPWVTGFAWQRLKKHSNSPRALHRLGVYGWLEGPFIGEPGPTNSGRLHSPSHPQTLASLVLRDKFLASSRSGLTNEQGGNPWQMDITSQKARLAEEIADEVRMGFHIYEVLGRHVENIVAHPQTVRELRRNDDYAMRAERLDPNEVCNGLAALSGLLGSAPNFEDDPDFPMDTNQKAALHLLSDALDTYGDLLMTDGVMQLVNRQADRAAESMDAAAGFSRPPSFEFLRTPPSGYQLESVVLSTLPFVAVDDAFIADHPIHLADPSVAAFLDQKLGDTWPWSARNEADGPIVGTVSLGGLGFNAADALALSDEFLRDLVMRQLGDESLLIEAPRQHQLAQQLVAALGDRPATRRDLVPDQAGQITVDAGMYDELRSRYERLHTVCTGLITGLRTAEDDQTRAVLLRKALPWGVAPVSRPEDREALIASLLGQEPNQPATSLSEMADLVADLLEKRQQDAPAPASVLAGAEISAPLESHEERKRLSLPDGISSLARVIATFASPNARLAVLTRWPKSDLVSSAGLAVDQMEPDFDEEWLTIVAATRASLARLEALQLELEEPFEASTSSPGDPWRTGSQNVVQRNLKERHEQSPANLDMTRFVAAYGPSGALDGATLAVGLIDAFAEAIPMPQRSTMAAFGFNAPAARAPQAILLAVPPKFRQRLDSTLLMDILEETRVLALARAANVEDLGYAQAVLPTMWLQASGPPRVRLEPWPLYEWGVS